MRPLPSPAPVLVVRRVGGLPRTPDHRHRIAAGKARETAPSPGVLPMPAPTGSRPQPELRWTWGRVLRPVSLPRRCAGHDRTCKDFDVPLPGKTPVLDGGTFGCPETNTFLPLNRLPSNKQRQEFFRRTDLPNPITSRLQPTDAPNARAGWSTLRTGTTPT